MSKRMRVSEEAYILVSDLQRLRIVLEILREVTIITEPDLQPGYAALQDKVLELHRRLGSLP